MKNLRLVWVAFLALSFAITSCENNSVSPDEFDSAAIDFMFLASSNDTPMPNMPNMSNMSNSKGGKHKITQIEVSALPTTVISYVNTTYAGSSIKHAGTDLLGNFLVHITFADNSHKGLVFDKAGQFVSERSGKGKRGVKVEVANLPPSISAYVTNTYPGYNIKIAFKNTDGNFAVVIKKADETKIVLGFDATGAFKGELSMKDFGKKRK